MSVRIEHLVTAGTFSLDGQTQAVENNVWLVGDDEEVLLVDASHDPDAIEAAVGDRNVVAVVCTHAHDDHVRYAPEVGERLTAPVLLHPDDRALWDLVHARHEPDGPLRDGLDIEVAGTHLRVLHTPGHTPGGVCLHAPELDVVFTGDTLLADGPGATGGSQSSRPAVLESIRTRLLTLPPQTRVLPGHGDATTLEAVRGHYDEWVSQAASAATTSAGTPLTDREHTA